MSRTARWIELGLLFGVVPALLAARARALALPFLFVTAWICLGVLWRDPTFQRDQLWRRERLWTWLRGPLALALATCSLLAVGLYLLEPAHLFDLPRGTPWRWLLVMVLYPVLSVVPQELVFRTFFFHRYATLFTRPAARVLASGLIFGWAHVAVNNGAGILLATAAGLAMAATYERSRSTLLVTIEHALYGDLAFTAGLGALFYSKARWVAGLSP